MSGNPKHGKIAFITTPDFRAKRSADAEAFVYSHIYGLCRAFTVMTTGRTHEFLEQILQRGLRATTKDHLKRIAVDMHTDPDRIDAGQLENWKTTVRDGLDPTLSSYPGMIHVAYELVEGRLDALIHLTDWQDKSAKPDSAVLSREANVHNVPAATDIETATAFVRSWQAKLAKGPKDLTLFRERAEPTNPPLWGLEPEHEVIALVAHDKMKLEMCCFAVEHASHIFERYDYVLATGTTGTWLKRFMRAAGRGRDDIRRIRLCNSGPLGGDLQIAYAVTRELCKQIVFLQDPSESHPHDSDIRLFEQAVVAENVKVRLATNLDSARLLIGV